MRRSLEYIAAAARRYAIAHKGMTAVAIAVVAVGGYWGYHRTNAATVQTRYVLGTVATGTIVASVSESGQVSATDSVDIKPQVSGTITWVGVKAGQRVAAGQALATLDDTDAAQALASAKKQYEADQLQYQKDTAQAPITYQNDQLALQNAKTQLSDDYNTAYNHLTSIYLDLPDLVNKAHDILYGFDFDARRVQGNADVLANAMTTDPSHDSKTLLSFKSASLADYASARSAYDSSIKTYQQTTRSSTPAEIENLLNQSVDTMNAVTQALQTELNFFGTASDMSQTYSINLPTAFVSVQSSAKTNLATANSDLSTLLSDTKTISNDKQAITKAQQQIDLDNVGNDASGSNPISLQISANSLAKEEQSIASQETDLAKYTIRAPFAGTLSTVDMHVGDSAGGASVATIISKSQIAKLSLNEVDAAKIKLGEKVTLTFDAIDGLSLTGEVASIDTVGTVSQGVVSYEVDVSFDTQDARVLPGMTVSADIQTGIAQNTLVVPSSAVKTANGESVVFVFVPKIDDAAIAAGGASGVVSQTPPSAVPVTTGISDDTNVQILSGLTAGEQIVTNTRSGSNTATAAASATSRTAGGNRGFGAGAAVRAF